MCLGQIKPLSQSPDTNIKFVTCKVKGQVNLYTLQNMSGYQILMLQVQILIKKNLKDIQCNISAIKL